MSRFGFPRVESFLSLLGLGKLLESCFPRMNICEQKKDCTVLCLSIVVVGKHFTFVLIVV